MHGEVEHLKTESTNESTLPQSSTTIKGLADGASDGNPNKNNMQFLIENHEMSFQRPSLIHSDQGNAEGGILRTNVRASVRRPEDVKFRMPEEEIATKNL